VKGVYDHTYANIVLSPSGQYIFYLESAENPDGTASNEESIGKVMELVMDSKTKVFTLELRREIKDFTERYKKTCQDFNTYQYYGGSKMFLSDKMEIFYTDNTKNIMMYEDIDCFKEIEGKFGMKQYETDKPKDLNDLTLVMKNGGFAISTGEEVYFLRVNSDLGTIMQLKRINFKISTGELLIEKICS
jgi:hypothetical protein